jgi:hypothetical protein
MSRGLTDLPPEPEKNQAQSEELDQVIREIIIGQNKLHDRLVQLERDMDQMAYHFASKEDGSRPPKKKWSMGL